MPFSKMEPPRTRFATIRDVARAANVSLGTISNVLNGHWQRMRPTTRRRVERAIRKLGYRPNRAARQLRTGRSLTIGLVVPSVANPFWGAFASQVEEAALGHGYQLMLFNCERDTRREARCVAELWRDGVREVILGSSLPSLDHVMDLIDRGLNVVAFDHRAQPNDPAAVISLSVDNHRGAWIAVRYLLKLGHRRIAFLSGPVQTISRKERLGGYRDALSAAGVEIEPRMIWTGGSRLGPGDVEGAELGRLGAQKLLARNDKRPSAILAINDMYAIGACAAARGLGLSVPEDVSVVGFDDILLARLVNPPLTTVRQPLRQMAQAAVQKLLRAQDGRTGRATSVVIRPRLIVRTSTAAPAADLVGGRDNHAVRLVH